MNDPTNQIFAAESGGDPTAKNANSSAAGPGQFIDSTWLDVVRQHAPEVAQGKSDAEILALKNDPTQAALPQNQALARQMTGAYAADNQAYLTKNGVPVTPGTTYLAHFAGPDGAVKILQANPNTSVSDILGPAAVKANPFLNGMTAQGLQAWAAKKMGVQAPSPGPRPAPQPPAGAPIFANAAPTAPKAPPAAGGAMAAPQDFQIQAPTPSPMIGGAAPQMAAPMFAGAPVRRPIDLSSLRALAQAPIFASRGNVNV